MLTAMQWIWFEMWMNRCDVNRGRCPWFHKLSIKILVHNIFTGCRHIYRWHTYIAYKSSALFFRLFFFYPPQKFVNFPHLYNEFECVVCLTLTAPDTLLIQMMSLWLHQPLNYLTYFLRFDSPYCDFQLDSTTLFQ